MKEVERESEESVVDAVKEFCIHIHYCNKGLTYVITGPHVWGESLCY